MNYFIEKHDSESSSVKKIVEELTTTVREHGLVIFAGAGISVPAPSSCPTWIGLRREILGQFLNKLIREDWPIKSYLDQSKTDILDMQLRPETFMWALIGDIGIKQTLKMLSGINCSSPNSNHESIASLVNNGVVKTIVTTNFDTYIEKSLDVRNIRYSPVRDINEAVDWFTAPKSNVLVFKPHGCLSKPSSMEYRIDQIQVLPESKKNLLTSILLSAPVLVVGYSGNDEDIFPTISSTLAESRFKSYICFYRPNDEPIQTWNINGLNQINRFHGDPKFILSSLAAVYENKRKGESSIANSSQAVNNDQIWKKNITNCVEEITHDNVAIAISHLCSLHGNHRRALSFANLAQDICEDTNLSHTPRESLMFIKELQSRAYKELEEYKQLAENQQKARLQEALKGSNYQEVIGALLDRAHVELRNNNLESAERDLNLVGVHLRKSGVKRPEDADYNVLSFLWYSGILKRKQAKTHEADILFNQAIAIVHAQNDIVHGGRILLDYGYVKCQMNDWESAQQIWGLAVSLAERANDWDTAAKGAKNRGILLSVSDNPHLGKPELERSKMLFERAGDYEGVKRAEEVLKYSRQEFMLAALSLGKLGFTIAGK